eukprot:5430297-Pleurochrysis_carterae.AAC.1
MDTAAIGTDQRSPLLPLSLPVQGVMAGKGKKNSADAKRCPAAMLRGKASSGRAADCKQNGWNIYFGYSPGVAASQSRNSADSLLFWLQQEGSVHAAIPVRRRIRRLRP